MAHNIMNINQFAHYNQVMKPQHNYQRNIQPKPQPVFDTFDKLKYPCCK
jgi:hypothetical protein